MLVQAANQACIVHHACCFAVPCIQHAACNIKLCQSDSTDLARQLELIVVPTESRDAKNMECLKLWFSHFLIWSILVYTSLGMHSHAGIQSFPSSLPHTAVKLALVKLTYRPHHCPLGAFFSCNCFARASLTVVYLQCSAIVIVHE